MVLARRPRGTALRCTQRLLDMIDDKATPRRTQYFSNAFITRSKVGLSYLANQLEMSAMLANSLCIAHCRDELP